MNEGVFYGLYFAIILFTYVTKMQIEASGQKAGRSNMREGIISGISVYLLYQTLTLPGISSRARIVDAVLGIASLAAGAVFFLRRK